LCRTCHRRLSFEEWCALAAEAGFRNIGWALDDYLREREVGTSDSDIRAISRAHEVHVAEIEFLKRGLT
jgi:hypothetical protein